MVAQDYGYVPGDIPLTWPLPPNASSSGTMHHFSTRDCLYEEHGTVPTYTASASNDINGTLPHAAPRARPRARPLQVAADTTGCLCAA